MLNGEKRRPRRQLEPGFERHHAPIELASHPTGHDEPDPQGQRVNYVPGDICIVVSTNPGASPDAAYSRVADALTRAFEKQGFKFELKDTGNPGDDPRVLIRDRTEEYSDEGQELRSWVQLPSPGDGLGGHALLFYSVTRAGEGQGDIALEVFNSINQQIRRDGIPTPSADLAIAGADLNWNHAGAGDHSQGCPASRPEPAPDGDWQFDIPDDDDDNDDEREDEQTAAAPVLVVVLDTCPDPRVVHDAATHFPENDLLQKVDHANPVVLNSPLSLKRAACTYLDPITGLPSMESWHLEAHPVPGSNWDDFRMDDHGLFVSGIVRDIAEDAQIELIRVLGDYGVGHSRGIIQVLGQLVDRLVQQPGLRMIVNLSLVASIPPNQWELPGAYLSLKLAIQALVAKGALVIASAGNEDLGTVYPNMPAPPMFPARMNEVLSVSAINHYDQKSWFADRATLLGSSNGVAVFGGDILSSGDGGHHPLIDMSPAGDDRRVDSVVGIFSAYKRPLPLNIQVNPSMALGANRTNTTGWVYWSGSSFATPVISGIAANAWAAHGAWTAPKVRQYVLDVADLGDTDTAFLAYDGAHRVFVDQHP